jgi:cell division protein FtsB
MASAPAVVGQVGLRGCEKIPRTQYGTGFFSQPLRDVTEYAMTHKDVVIKVGVVSLLTLFGGLQFRLWVGEGSLTELYGLRQEIIVWHQNNDRLMQRNAMLAAEVSDLKTGLAAVEERARVGLGMIQSDETFIYVVE